MAGGKLFESSLNLSYSMGLWVTAGVVVAYTLFGGFLAVSLTDFVQGVIMLIAMLIVPVVAFGEIGGVSEAMAIATQTNTEVFNWMNGVTVMGVISLMAWGFGYFGQPHIIVRFMAIRSVKDVPTAMVIGMGWMILSPIGALMVGFGRDCLCGTHRYRALAILKPSFGIFTSAVSSADFRIFVGGNFSSNYEYHLKPIAGGLKFTGHEIFISYFG